MDGKDANADLQMDRTEEGKSKIKMECRGEKASTQRVAQLAVKAAREESVNRWRKEQWINNPWLEGELGPVTTQESRAAMMGGELKEGGKAGWEEGKKCQARTRNETYRQHTNGWMSKHGKEYAWRQKGEKIATDP